MKEHSYTRQGDLHDQEEHHMKRRAASSLGESDEKGGSPSQPDPACADFVAYRPWPQGPRLVYRPDHRGVHGE